MRLRECFRFFFLRKKSTSTSEKETCFFFEGGETSRTEKSARPLCALSLFRILLVPWFKRAPPPFFPSCNIINKEREMKIKSKEE